MSVIYRVRFPTADMLFSVFKAKMEQWRALGSLGLIGRAGRAVGVILFAFSAFTASAYTELSDMSITEEASVYTFHSSRQWGDNWASFGTASSSVFGGVDSSCVSWSLPEGDSLDVALPTSDCEGAYHFIGIGDYYGQVYRGGTTESATWSLTPPNANTESTVTIPLPVYGSLVATTTLGIVDVQVDYEISTTWDDATSTLSVMSSSGTCLPYYILIDPEIQDGTQYFECPADVIYATDITAVLSQIPYTAVSTTTRLYGGDFERLFGYPATSTPELSAALEECNNAVCAVSDISGCFKVAICWAFVPSQETWTKFQGDINPLDNTVYGYAGTVSGWIGSVWTPDTDASVDDITITIPNTYGGDTSDTFTMLDISDLKSRSAEGEQAVEVPLGTFVALLTLFYFVDVFRRLSGAPSPEPQEHYFAITRKDTGRVIFERGKRSAGWKANKAHGWSKK